MNPETTSTSESTPATPSPTVTPTQIPTTTLPQYPDKSTSTWAVIGLLVAFPPAAWALMWKNKRFHTWFHKILFIYGILGLFGVVDLYASIPEINQTYRGLGLSAPSNLTSINELNLVFSLLQIGYAVYLWFKLRKNDINVFDVIASGIIIVIPFFIILYLMMITFLTPIYNISSQLPY